jgi:hypothetical protein
VRGIRRVLIYAAVLLLPLLKASVLAAVGLTHIGYLVSNLALEVGILFFFLLLGANWFFASAVAKS